MQRTTFLQDVATGSRHIDRGPDHSDDMAVEDQYRWSYSTQMFNTIQIFYRLLPGDPISHCLLTP